MTAPWPGNGYDPNDDGLVDNPMYQQTGSTTALSQTYEEVKLKGSRFHESGGGRSTTPNAIYGMGLKHSQVLQHPTTLSLDQVYKFTSDEQEGGDRLRCRLSYSCLLCVISLLIMLLSACALVVFALIMFSVGTLSSPTAAAPPSNCSCADPLDGSLNSSLLMLQQFSSQLMDIQSEIANLQQQDQESTDKVLPTLEELLEQVKVFNSSLEEAKSLAEKIKVDVGVGKAYPALININIFSGCEERTEEEMIGLATFSHNPIDYIDETHVIVDVTCEVEENSAPTLQGVGVIGVNLKLNRTANASDGFNFLSNAEFQCNCYFPGITSAICRYIVVRCPYTRQGIDSTIIT